MSQGCILPDGPVPDFRARITRRAAARPLTRRQGRNPAVRRLGVLAAAAAVPALAAPGVTDLPPAAPATAIAPMGFEIPGESFPGSAFYYLEDAPVLTERPAETAAADPSAAAPALTISPGPLARSLRVTGSEADRANAQRCMTMAIYYEAASESDAGQRAVAQVVLNRVAHPAYPDNVCGVVMQGAERSTGCQFSFTCDGSLARAPSPIFWNRAGRIARQALAGAVYAPVGLATHYHTLAVHPHWAASLDRVTVIGAHQFYRWRGAAGQPGAFRWAYGGGESAPATRQLAARANPAAQAAPAPASPDEAFAATPMQTLQPAPLALDTDAALPSAPGERAAHATSGSVRREFARAGRWIASPAAPRP